MAEITGRKVFFFTAGAFGVIIAVNLVLATQAVRTFPGLEVKNSYIASQTFDAERAAQEALGWQLDYGYDAGAGELRLSFTETGTGHPAEVADMSVLVGRATEARDDQTPQFVREAGAFVAPLTLAPGKWLLRVEARAADGTRFHQRLDLFVKG